MPVIFTVPLVRFTDAVEVVGEPSVNPSDATGSTVTAEVWLPPMRASVPAATVVVPV